MKEELIQLGFKTDDDSEYVLELDHHEELIYYIHGGVYIGVPHDMVYLPNCETIEDVRNLIRMYGK